MESDIMRLHAPSPPPPLDDEDDDDADGEMRSEEDEFGNFHAGMSCSPVGFAHSSELPSSFRSPPPDAKPATHQPGCGFARPVEQSQPASTVKLESSRGRADGRAASSPRLTNGHGERRSGAHSPEEETGFADFTVFADQTAHPWCCGFSPMSNAERWESRLNGGTENSGGQIRDPGPEVIMKFEPGSQCAHQARVKHCECRDAALAPSSQDGFVFLEAAEPFDFPSDVAEWDGEARREDREDGVSAIPRTFTSEDPASFSDDLSFEGASTADLEPNVSSLVSMGDSTDWDRTDDEAEELEDFTYLSEASFHRPEQHATQGTSATSSPPQSQTDPGDGFADFTAGRLERRGDRESVRTADAGVLSLGNLPPSDSFADFCSAPPQEDAASWAEFKDQSTEAEGKTWTRFRESVSSLQTSEETEEQDGEGGGRRDSQASLSSRVQQLLQSSFPEVSVTAVEGEEEPLSLGALLQNQHPPESREEPANPSGAQRVQQEMLHSLQDVHSALGLQFQWGGSRVNSTLLSCLGVDTRNIVFMGTKKQPVAVPAFASGLGLLEPTKDPAPAVSSPGRRVVTTGEPPGPRDLSAHPAQEFPSRQLDWSSRGLSSSQDGCSALDLDYFGREEEEEEDEDEEEEEEESRSSRNNLPPPGLDPELYELSRTELDSSSSSSNVQDALKRLLSSAGTTCTSVRKPLQEENLSADACSVIHGLPNLSFMQATVLMFPSVLVPTA